jgi:nucleoside diphosphate kinase
MKYDYIKELNRENDRRILNPFTVALVCIIAISPVVILILKFADWIDAQRTVMSSEAQVTLGLFLVVGAFIGLIVWVKKMTW